ncbi:MAG: hypothetical protein IT210_15140 [Armatimonadetes bacterium]|nr:hypothetical protein [Armatimonadota bacterium]
MAWLDFPIKAPQPDAGYFADVLFKRREPHRATFIEYLINEPNKKRVVEEALDREWVPWGGDRAQQERYLDNFIAIFHQLGYDIIRYEQGVSFPGRPGRLASDGRSWVDDHCGAIASWEDFERYDWPSGKSVDLSAYEYISRRMMEGSAIIASSSGGVFEGLKNALMGIDTLSYLLYDDPDLVAAVFDRVGQAIYEFYESLIGLPGLIGFLQGDDMGHKTGTLISVKALRRYVFPWHRKLARLCHDHGLFYCLHSCGNLEEAMEDLIGDVGIDGKHSYEDVIVPVGQFKERYGERIAVLGGVDIDKLTRLPEPELRRYVRGILDACMPGGGYALGSGNSIPDYIPMENYLTMLDEGLRWDRS